MRRFLQHVLPKGFTKIRHYGLLSNRQRQARLRLARRLLLPITALASAALAAIEPAELPRCPQCGSVRQLRAELLPPVTSSPFVSVGPEPPGSEADDTS